MSRTVTTRTTNLAELHRQNVRRTNRLIRPILHLQNHRAALKSPQRVPLTGWNIQRTNRTASRKLIRSLNKPLRRIILLHTRPRSTTTVSEVFRCLWIGTTDPGSIAFSILCDVSAAEFLRSMFMRRRGEACAWAVRLSSNVLSIFILKYHRAKVNPDPRRTAYRSIT